ncbi:MAG: FliM/FliN family flagellar motor switch protein [Terriglobales bacterium]
MSVTATGSQLDSFLEVIRQATCEVFSKSLGATWSAEIDTSERASAPDDAVVYFEVSSSGDLQGGASIEIRTPDALFLSQTFLAEPIDVSAELTEPRREGLEQLLRQVAGAAAKALGSICGEVAMEVTSGEPPAGQQTTVTLVVSGGSSSNLALKLSLSPELVASISAARPNPTPASHADSAAIPREPNVNLLLEVKLNLVLRFGQRMLSLREILDLNAGAVIELNREVQEPADLLLGDKVIARGQVVIVDGNYGLRITEVVDTQQRIETL